MADFLIKYTGVLSEKYSIVFKGFKELHYWKRTEKLTNFRGGFELEGESVILEINHTNTT